MRIMNLTSEQNVKEKLWSNPIIAIILLVTLASVGVWQALDTMYAKLREAEQARLITARLNAENLLENTKQYFSEQISLIKLSHHNELSQEKLLTASAKSALLTAKQNLENMKENVLLANEPNEETMQKLETQRYISLQKELTQKQDELRLQKRLNNNLNIQLKDSQSELVAVKQSNSQLDIAKNILQTVNVKLAKNQTKVLFNGQLSIILKNVQELFTNGVRFHYTFQSNAQPYKVSGLSAGDSVARKDVHQGFLYVFTVIEFDDKAEEASFEIAKIKLTE